MRKLTAKIKLKQLTFKELEAIQVKKDLDNAINMLTNHILFKDGTPRGLHSMHNRMHLSMALVHLHEIHIFTVNN